MSVVFGLAAQVSSWQHWQVHPWHLRKPLQDRGAQVTLRYVCTLRLAVGVTWQRDPPGGDADDRDTGQGADNVERLQFSTARTEPSDNSGILHATHW